MSKRKKEVDLSEYGKRRKMIGNFSKLQLQDPNPLTSESHMQLDEDKNRVYVASLDESDDEKEEDKGITFWNNIEKRFMQLPRHVLVPQKPEENALVLYRPLESYLPPQNESQRGDETHVDDQGTEMELD